MRKTPLNNEIREATLRAVIAHRFDDQEKRLQKQKDSLADHFYRTLLSAADRDKIRKAPPGWFKEESGCYFYVDGKCYHLSFSEPRRVPFAWDRHSCTDHNLTSVSGDHPAGAAALAYYEAKEKMDHDRAAASSVVRSTLHAFRYVEDLVEAWPEVKKFIPATTKQVMTSALAIPPKQLNEMLGLS